MNVLLVDDEKLLLAQLEDAVKASLPMANLRSFSKAKEALEYANACTIDIAFLDINMRGIDGITMARLLQDLNSKVNIIFCTGYSEYAMDALDIHCSGYLLKPVTKEKVDDAVAHLRFTVSAAPTITLRCFGNFEAYCNGVPIKFKYSRTKEMLAYLVDRNGTSISMGELSSVLFEDDMHRSYLNQIRLDLINTFDTLGAPDVIVQTKGYLSINRDLVKCDYFDYLDHKYQVTTREYMTQYSFSEYTFSNLFLDGTYPAIELDE